MYFLVLISIVVVLLCVSYMQANTNIPGPGVLEVVKNLGGIINQPHAVMTQWATRYGKIFSFRCGLRSIVVINDADLIQQIFKQSSTAGRFTHHAICNTKNQNGHGVLHSEGKWWEEQNKFILRNIKLRKSTPAETIMLTEANILVDFLITNKGQPIECSELVKLAVANTLWQIVLNCRAANIGEKDTGLEAVEHVLNNFFRITNSPLFLFPWLRFLMPQWTGWRNYVESIQKMNHLMEKQIDEHFETFNQYYLRLTKGFRCLANFVGGKLHEWQTLQVAEFVGSKYPVANSKDLTDYFISQIKKTSNPDSSFYQKSGRRNMVSSLTELLLKGIETSSSTLSWALLFLSEHPNIQDKLHEEVDSVVGTYPVSLVYRSRMPYIKAIISEVLKLGCVTPLGLPHVMTTEKTVQGYKLPKGSYIIYNLFAVQHSKTIWKDPKNFRPERFLENGQYVNRERLIPFSEGKQKCIGEESAQDLIFLFLVTIFQQFSVKPEYPGKTANFEPKFGTVLIPQPFKVVFENRGM